MNKKRESILRKLYCPIISYVFSFAVLLCILYITISYMTRTTDYARNIKENEILNRMQQVVYDCKGDYSASLIAIKSNDPKRFVFRDVFFFNKILQTSASAKNLNSDYTKSYSIDDALYNIIDQLKTGEVATPELSKLEKSKSFRKISNISNSNIKNIAISVVKYENGNIRYVMTVALLENSGSKFCTKNDLVKKIDYILIGVDNGVYY